MTCHTFHIRPAHDRCLYVYILKYHEKNMKNIYLENKIMFFLVYVLGKYFFNYISHFRGKI